MILASLTRDQVRAVDQRAIESFGMSGLVLMENAGRGAAEMIATLCSSGRIDILCGKGNNAGDGYVIARHLQLLDHHVRILSLVQTETLSGDALTNARIAEKSELAIEVVTEPKGLPQAVSDAAVIVDCLLGTGATGAPRGTFADAVNAANAASAIRVAIDIPTGLDADTGVPHSPTFRADLTLSFVALKKGFENPIAKALLGRCEVIGIGVPKKLLTQFSSP